MCDQSANAPDLSIQRAAERHRAIAECAYFKALARRFADGDPLQDWLSAELEVDLRTASVNANKGALRWCR